MKYGSPAFSSFLNNMKVLGKGPPPEKKNILGVVTAGRHIVVKADSSHNRVLIMDNFYPRPVSINSSIMQVDVPTGLNERHQTSLFYEARVSFDEGRQRKEAEDHNEDFKKIFQERMRTSKCFATDGSKMDDKPFVGFASIDTNDGRSRKFRISKIASTFTAEALAIGETLEITEKIDSEQTFTIFSDSASVLKGISNSPTMRNSLHITQMLKD
jgi:hypothetical protein